MSRFAIDPVSLPEGAPAAEEMPPRERWFALALLGLGLIFRFLYTWHYRIDSDEPQHLHVVWAWAHGLLPYRDVFDNHAPLFQALYAPVFHLLGVRADILLPMRLAELPLFAATLYAVWKIAGALYTPRTALWTTVLAALFPPIRFTDEFHFDGFYLSSIEFRPDQLWALLWLIVLLILATGRINARRTFLAGLILGIAFSVSMKTTLLLATLLVSGVGALIVRRCAGGLDLEWPKLWARLGAGLAGIPLIPALVVLYFYTHGAIHSLYECVITHNILPGSSLHLFSNGTMKCFLFGLPAAVGGSYLIARLEKSIAVRARIGFVYLAALLYLVILKAFWPVITEEDYLPLYPAIMLTAGPALLWLVTFAARSASLAGPLLAGAEMIGILVAASPFQDLTTDKIGMVADTLKLTAPDDYVMDSKGETIYRRRPYRYVFESRTFHRVKMGAIKDDIADHLIQTRTPLATTIRMPHHARDFIKANYVPIAFRLRVVGQVLREPGVAAKGKCYFQINVPQRYTLITPAGAPAGLLDGTPFTGPRELAAGKHVFLPDDPPDSLVLIWANAIERGYSPFAKIKDDQMTAQD
ncbi:MAG TPA: hypothetical protein VGM54_08730 [Chthoniobacter sp.]|jgi:hypothetical protein